MSTRLIIELDVALVGPAYRAVRADSARLIVTIELDAVGMIFETHLVEFGAQLRTTLRCVEHRSVLLGRHDSPCAGAQEVPYDGVLDHALVCTGDDLLSYRLPLRLVARQQRRS